MASSVTTSPQGAANAFSLLLALGYTGVVCVIPPGAALKPDIPNFAGTSRSRGKCPGVLTPQGWVPYNYRTRPFDPETDPALFHSWGGSVGLRLSGDLIAFDMDCRNKDLSNAVAKIVREKLGLPPARVGLAPKALFLMRVHRDDLERIRYRALHFDDGTDKRAGLEILAGDRQFIVKGPYGLDGEPAGFDYVWVDGYMRRYEDLPVVRWAAIEAVLSECAEFLPKADRPGRASLAIVRTEVAQDSLKAGEAHVARLVSSIPNTRRYDAMIEMAAAIRGASQDAPDEGLATFLEWCARWEDGEADLAYCERIFESLEPPFGLGVQRLEYLAGHGDGSSEGSGRIEADPGRYLGEIDQAAVDAAVALFPAMPAGGVSMADVERPARPPLALTSFAQAVLDARTAGKPPLIKGLFDRGAASILYGDSNVGKTFVGLLKGFHIALGKPFAGMRVTKGRVIYAAAEGGDGIRRRAVALAKRYGEEPELFEFLIAPINLLDPEADLQPLIALCRGGDGREDPAIIFLDTLSRIMAGGDENASTDMGALVTNLDRLRVATGAHICVIHHTGKDAARGARGHSLLRAAIDTEVEVTVGEIAVTKQRDLPKEWRGKFTLENVDLWTDDDGDRVQSAVAVLEAPEAVEECAVVTGGDVKGNEQRVLASVVWLHAALKRSITASDVTDNLKGAIPQNSVRAVLHDLLGKGLVAAQGRGAWRPTPSGKAVSKRTDSPGVGLLQPVDENGETLPGLFD